MPTRISFRAISTSSQLYFVGSYGLCRKLIALLSRVGLPEMMAGLARRIRKKDTTGMPKGHISSATMPMLMTPDHWDVVDPSLLMHWIS